jgi:hypothetical protein
VVRKTHMQLPPLAVGIVDIGRLIRELEAIDETLHQLRLRHGGGAVKLPKTSGLLDQVVDKNKLNLLHQDDREELIGFLKMIKQKAPTVHISFSADPSTAFLEKLMIWMRREFHPYILMTIGLQPNIGAGCVMRTTNKYFDLSLKQSFADRSGLLIEKLFPEDFEKRGPEKPAQALNPINDLEATANVSAPVVNP